MGMLHLREALGQRTNAAIHDIGKIGDAMATIGLLVAPALQPVPHQIAHRLRPAGIALVPDHMVERMAEVVVEGNSDPLHEAPRVAGRRVAADYVE